MQTTCKEAMRQTCKHCGCEDFFNYNVPDDLWQSVVPESLRKRVVCLKCFDRLAKQKDVSYAHAIDRVYFAGEKATFEFETVDAADYT